SGNYPRGHYKKQPIPGPQENMPGGERAPVKPAMKVFESYKLDLSKVPLPKETETVLKNADKSGKFMAGSILPLLPRTFLAFVFHYIGFILPFVLFSAWTMTAWKDLLERTDLGKGTTYSWLICTILLPFIGSAAYHLAGKSTLPKWMRYSMIFGGAGFFILLFVYVGISLSSGIGNKQLE
ncbi:MAG: plastocyanin, partial [Leptospira sp.]|nr:plastocyanin [Leptospira sp.]